MITDNPLGVLQRIRATRRVRPETIERCELCCTEIGPGHAHVVDVESRTLKCTCRPCSFLFWGGAAGGKLRTVPDRWSAIDDLRLAQADWDDLQIPVNLAFFFRSSVTGDVTAFYPSPAGATESLLDVHAWARIVEANPGLATAEDDVEAVIVRVVEGRFEAFVVPVDACYELVGHLRRLWRGFDGGQDARAYAEEFFVRLRTRAPSAQAAGR